MPIALVFIPRGGSRRHAPSGYSLETATTSQLLDVTARLVPPRSIRCLSRNHFTFRRYLIRLSWVSCSCDLLQAQGGANVNGPEILHLIRQDLQRAVALQGRPPDPRPLDVSPWLAMSVMQKAIRRGREDLALGAAATLLGTHRRNSGGALVASHMKTSGWRGWRP